MKDVSLIIGALISVFLKHFACFPFVYSIWISEFGFRKKTDMTAIEYGMLWKATGCPTDELSSVIALRVRQEFTVVCRR